MKCNLMKDVLTVKKMLKNLIQQRSNCRYFSFIFVRQKKINRSLNFLFVLLNPMTLSLCVYETFPNLYNSQYFRIELTMFHML